MAKERGTTYGVIKELALEYGVSIHAVAGRCRGVDFGVRQHKTTHLSPTDKEDIRKRNAAGGRGIQRVLAEEYGVSKPLISKICRI